METWERRGGDSPGWPGQRENYSTGGACVQSAVASGLGGEEQAGELTAAAVSVHKGQGVLCVVLDHGAHGGEQLDRKQGIGESPEPHAGRSFLKELWDSEEEACSHFSKLFFFSSLPHEGPLPFYAPFQALHSFLGLHPRACC